MSAERPSRTPRLRRTSERPTASRGSGQGSGNSGPRPNARRRRARRVKGRKLYDMVSGLRGWTQQMPGNRDVVTPCIAEGRVLLGGGFGSYAFYAFDARSGDLLWARRTRDDGPTSAICAEGFVVFNTESCTVCVLRADTGAHVWEKWLGDPLLAQPAVGEGLVFMVWPSEGEHFMSAYRLASGREVWRSQLEADVISAPVFCEGRVYATTFDGNVHCWDGHDGSHEWALRMRATSAPWIWKGEVFVSHWDEASPAGAHVPLETLGSTDGSWYRKRGDSKHASYLRSRRGTPMGHADLEKDQSVGFGNAPSSAKLHHAESLTGSTTVSRAWSFQGSRPCVWNDRVYSVVGDELTASCLYSGREFWSVNARFDDEGERGITPPVVTNGRVYAGTRDGRICSWDAESGEARWKANIGHPVLWQPVVAAGRVFAGCQGGRLVALSTEDPSDDGWPMWGGGPGHNG